ALESWLGFNSEVYEPVTNFSCPAVQEMQAQFLASSNGAYAYCEVDRHVINRPGQWPSAWVYNVLHISGATPDSLPDGGSTFAASYNSATELVAVQYIPDSPTDNPPISISFQENVLVQGQITAEYDSPLQIDSLVYVWDTTHVLPYYPQDLNVPDVTFSF